MTTLREAAQQALEAMDKATRCMSDADYKKLNQAIEELRAALAEPENWELRRLREELERCKKTCAATSEAWRKEKTEPVQEPVAWRFQSAVGGWAHGSQPPVGSKYPAFPLYAAPPQRKPLPEKKIKQLLIEHAGMTVVFSEVDLRFARAIERAHGIKE